MSTPISHLFSQAARWTAYQAGRASTFALAIAVVVVWAATGPLFHYSDTWQLVINTGTTIVTFLMVFLLQNAQNRDATTIQLKLDELIRANEAARNKLLTLEDLTEAELDHLKTAFMAIAAKDNDAQTRESLREAGQGLADLQDRGDGVAA